jgi:hypothetical protein
METVTTYHTNGGVSLEIYRVKRIIARAADIYRDLDKMIWEEVLGDIWFDLERRMQA